MQLIDPGAIAYPSNCLVVRSIAQPKYLTKSFTVLTIIPAI